jgi:signal transduction histidine kinase
VRFRARSLLSRILWLHGIAVLVTAVAVSAGVYLFLDTTADRFQREILREHAEAAAKRLTRTADGRLELGPLRPGSPAPSRPFSVILIDAAGLEIASTGTRVTPLARIPRQANPVYFTRQSRAAIYSGYSLPIRRDGSPAWLVAIQNLEHPDYIVDDILRQFLVYGGAIVLPLLLLLLAADAWIIRRALRPVRDASALVRTLGPKQLDVRVPEADLPREVRPLAEAMNAALDRVVEGYQTQRDFIADAAHELRTPIALARMRAEEVADEALRKRLKRDLDHFGRTVGQLLEIAELDGAALDFDDCVDLRRMAAEAASAFAPLAFQRRQGIALVAGDEPVWVRGHAEMIARVLKALTENAIAHTPPGTAIEISVTPDGMLAVTDDGPGIGEGDEALIFRRFWRRDRSAGHSSGLGLAIVARIAEAHGTNVSVRSRKGETRFEIRFTPI